MVTGDNGQFGAGGDSDVAVFDVDHVLSRGHWRVTVWRRVVNTGVTNSYQKSLCEFRKNFVRYKLQKGYHTYTHVRTRTHARTHTYICT